MERRHRDARRDRAARFTGFGPGHYASRTDKDRKARTTSGNWKRSGSPSPWHCRLTRTDPYQHTPGHGSLPRPAAGWLSG